MALGALFLAALQMGIRPVNPNPKSTVELTWFALLEAEIEFDVLQSKLAFFILIIYIENHHLMHFVRLFVFSCLLGHR